METRKNVAIVLGASMAGLLAAAALSRTFGHVLLVEKAALPDGPVARTSVPQGQHAHGLLSGGLDALDVLLPGLVAALAEAGCPTGDSLEDCAWIFGGKRLARGPSGVRGMTVARPVLEHAVRRRVLALPNVSLHTESRVTGVVCVEGRVTGVRVGAGNGETAVPGDLLVDASGRTSKLAEWLVAAGFAAPEVDEVALETHYSTRLYTRTPSQRPGDIAVLVVSSPECPRGGIALALDEFTWIVSQYALGGAKPPTDAEGFLRFSRTLPGPHLTALLQESDPIGETRTLRFPSSIRRRYEDLTRMPSGLVVVGDALSSFNPTFGQGITVAALEALVLLELSAGGAGTGFERRFQRRAAGIVDVAWNASVGRTFLYEGVRGTPTLKMRIGNLYLPRVVAAAHGDADVAARFLRTMNFVEPPGSLFSPSVLFRVLRGPTARPTPAPPTPALLVERRATAQDSPAAEVIGER
jgi:2-polyprenyl-6-methoxyphenol hydroxylase-like FAD-dependent oxidoreductase